MIDKLLRMYMHTIYDQVILLYLLLFFKTIYKFAAINP